MLEICPDKVCYVIVKAREFDVKDIGARPDPGSNPSDDGGRGVLADDPDDPVYEELIGLIESFNEDEQMDLVALAWLGREDLTSDDWPGIRAQARQRRMGSTARYLLGMPLLADYLEEGLSRLGYDCLGFEMEHL